MRKKWETVRGIVERGYRVASGDTEDSEYYPYGTIELQLPKFKERGLDLTQYYSATLNISIKPYTFEMKNPEITFKNVAWTSPDKHPPEHFSFSRCRVIFKNKSYDGWVYYPHPETKKRHFQRPDLIEIIAEKIDGISYDDEVELEINMAEVLINHDLAG